jgi:polyferredoxin
MPTAGTTRAAYGARRPPAAASTDLLRVPVLGRFLRWRGSRVAAQVPMAMLAALMVLHGLFGPSLAPKNLATLLAWVHFRGVLVLSLLVAGNVSCLACPFMLTRGLARRFVRPAFAWPRALRNKWPAVALFVIVLYAYELFGLWGSPRGTAWLILAYFAGAAAVDSAFKHAPFCKWVCPIGQFNFIASTLSPLEVRVRDPDACARCTTKDCIKGTPAGPATGSEPRRGCELALFQPLKVGNLDCTLCLDCVYACPHENIGILTRLPGSELWADTPRSGVGRPDERPDLAALATVFAFGALLNAFGMVSPVYAVQRRLSVLLGTTERAPILGLLFAAVLIVEPLLLLGLASWCTRGLTGTRRGLRALAVRYAYTLVPLGFATWLAHYGFHFFTGVLTVVPVAQNALADLGWPVLGPPRWEMVGLPERTVYPMELGFLGLGLVGSWIVSVRLARQDHPEAPARAWLPWCVLHSILWLSAVWLLSQPMEMRGTFLES